MATTAEIERVEAKIIAQKGAKSCDKYDYLTAVGCGVVAGLVDSFFVGMPGESKLGGWTDAQVDKSVDGHLMQEKKTVFRVRLVFWKETSE